jgi:hypothetical protein
MTNVQIAIGDQDYCEALRHLLLADGQHRVYDVEYPSPAIDGVVVADETVTGRMNLAEGVDLSRYVFFTRKVGLDVDRLWAAGIRHVIHADCPPHLGRLVVLAAEKKLSAHPVNGPLEHPQREADRKVQEQIRDLRTALETAVWNSADVAKAIGILRRSGREVQVEIDALVVSKEPRGKGSSAVAKDQPELPGMSIFDANDRLFLQTMKISDR